MAQVLETKKRQRKYSEDILHSICSYQRIEILKQMRFQGTLSMKQMDIIVHGKSAKTSNAKASYHRRSLMFHKLIAQNPHNHQYHITIRGLKCLDAVESILKSEMYITNV